MSSCGAGLAAIGPTSAGSSRIGVSQIAGSSRSAASGVAHVPNDLPTTSTRPDAGSAPATSARTQAIVCASDSYAGGSHQWCSTRQPCWSRARPVKNSKGAIGGYPRPGTSTAVPTGSPTGSNDVLKTPGTFIRSPSHREAMGDRTCVRFLACNAPLPAPRLRHVGAPEQLTERYKSAGSGVGCVGSGCVLRVGRRSSG